MKTAVKNRINISVLCFWFFILNIPLFWLVALRYFWGALIPDGWLADFYTVISYFPNIAILALLVNLLCFVVAIIWPKRLFIIILAIILNTVALFGIVIDASVFQLFHFHINWQYFDLIFSAQGRSVLDLGFSDWVLIAIILSLILFIEIGLAFLIVKKNYFKVFKRWMVYALIILLCCSFIEIAIFACAKATAYYPILEAGIHFPVYFRPHANKLVKKLHIFKIKHVSEYRFPRKSFDYPLHSSHSNDVKSSKMNVMMILIDTWRYDMMNPQTSPDIYKFSRNALVFNNHFSSGNMTKAGIFGLFYSIPIYYWSLTIDKHRMPLLMKILQQNKYQTAIYASAPLDMPYTFNKTVFQDIKHLQITTPGASPVARDKYITKEMLRFLHNHKPHNKPFFGFLFYDSVHAYSFPKNFPAKFKPYKRYSYAGLTDGAHIISYKNLYKNAVVFDDSLVNKILTELKQDGYLKNTIVIITADHGEAFNDYHQQIWGHGYSFAPPVTHIPFIVYWPHKKHRIIKYITTHYDVVPTLLQQIFKINNPVKDYSIGYSLFNSRSRPYILVGSSGSDYAVISHQKQIFVINTKSSIAYEANMQFKKLHAPIDLMAQNYLSHVFRTFG